MEGDKYIVDPSKSVNEYVRLIAVLVKVCVGVVFRRVIPVK